MRLNRKSLFNILFVSALVSALLLAAGCGGTKSTASANPAPSPAASPAPSPAPTPAATPIPTPTPTPAPGPNPSPSPSPTPTTGTQRGKVVVVLEENHSYSSVIGSSQMPYLNSLGTQYAMATQYYANTHPSIGNYFEMTTGQIITNNDAYMTTVTVPNIVSSMLTAGKTWKSYAESLPSVGYIGGDVLPYVRHHNPFSFFSEVVNSSTQRNNLVPFTQFAADLNAGQLPDFSFIAPNLNDDAHDGTLAQADTWLQTNIGPLLTNPQFQQNGLLIIVFDEAATSDSTNGGGHVAFVAVGPLVKKGFQSSVLYQHQNLLAMIAAYLGIDGNIGAAAGAPNMSDLLQ
jgi:phosphatidylinositol-3-phosphatase